MWERRGRSDGFVDDDDGDGGGRARGKGRDDGAAVKVRMLSQTQGSSGIGGRQTRQKWMQRTLAIMALLTAVMAANARVADAAVPTGSSSGSSACPRGSADWNAWTTVGCDVNCATENAVCKYVDPMIMSEPERDHLLASCVQRNQSDDGSCQDHGKCLVECMPTGAKEDDHRPDGSKSSEAN
ncbi:hypothetical protein FI667_g17703, partial [Globisporangium splendens]